MRVLVVEDNAKMARLLRRGLSEAGYAVDVAGDKATALTLGMEIEYDAILLDLVLGPSLGTGDGFEVCRCLRTADRWAPVVMLTARDAVGDRIRGLDAGADDYVTKPFARSTPACGREPRSSPPTFARMHRRFPPSSPI